MGERKTTTIPYRGSQEKFRKSIEADRRMAEITSKIRRGIDEAKRKRENGKRIGIQDEREIESRIALDYAKENDIWYPNIYKLGIPFSSGNENTNVLYSDEQVVYKSNNLMNSKIIINLFDRIHLHNRLFPETMYDFVGFTGIDSGEDRVPYIEVIFKQDLADKTIVATSKEISNFMKSIGFKKKTDTSFINNSYEVSDLFPRNVLKDKNGIIYVIDAEIKETFVN